MTAINEYAGQPVRPVINGGQANSRNDFPHPANVHRDFIVADLECESEHGSVGEGSWIPDSDFPQ
jgi:hypothetical protein